MTNSDPNERYERHELRQPGAVETWSGLDRTLNRPVTIRRAAADSEPGQRLRLQAKALARVEHHGLLHIFDTYSEADHFAIVTEQLPTKMLVDELATPEGGTKRLDVSEAVRIVIAVTEAVATLHSAGFAHGGVEAEYIGWRAEVGWVLLNGPPTDDAVSIPATRRADLVSIAALAHRLIVGAAPQRLPDGTWEIDPAVGDLLAPVLAKGIGASDPWLDAPSMLLALRSVLEDLPTDRDALTNHTSLWQSERNWLAPVGVLLTAAATLVGIAVIVDESPESSAPESPAPVTTVGQGGTQSANTTGLLPTVTAGPRPTTVTQLGPAATAVRRLPILLDSITDFDPAGDDRIEHPERLRFINDGDPDTGWNTARYSTRDFGGLKDGVGLIVVLHGDEPRPVTRLVIDSPTRDWSFELYASRERNRTLIDWGSPVATVQDINGSTALDLPITQAAALLVWITDLGNELPNGGYRVTISGIEVAAHSDAGTPPPGTGAVLP